MSRWFSAATVVALCCFANSLLTAADDQAQSSEAAFAKLLDEAWQNELVENPLLATQAGDRRYNDRLPRVRPADVERRHQQHLDLDKRLTAIDRERLPAEQQTNYDIFRRLLDDDLKAYSFQAHLMPITNRSGFHIEFPELPREVPLDTVQDYENYIARLRAFGDYTDDHIALLQAGIDAGMVLPAVVLEGFADPLQGQIVESPDASLLFAPFKKFPASVPADQQPKLTDAARQAILESVVPGYRRFLEFMRDKYVPAGRASIAASTLPRGREYYRYLVQRNTTLDLTPDQVHQIGLAEVARIDAEMRDVMDDVAFTGDFRQFVEFLRSDPRFYAKTREELLKDVSYVLKKMDGQLPKLFRKLPRAPYGVREVPEYIAPQTTTAYYMPPAGDGTRAGFFYVNTYNLKTRPLFEIEALSFHEAVPGHHLQIALQQELTDLPPFRRFNGFTAFVEGWGLYAERLGLEVGFYEDPYSNFGRLSYEMWRACRLVVDSGMHYLGWSREQAIKFMADHTALTMHNITTEVDRYIAWPGQALAYKMGELKIRELRKLAEQSLGDRFDVREFHAVVLDRGSVPLMVLQANVERYIAEKVQAK